MERNHIIGFILIFATLLVFNILTKPSEAELAKRKKEADSIALVQKKLNPQKLTTEKNPSTTESTNNSTSQSVKDSVIFLENEVMKVGFSSLGGKISSVELKKYLKKSEVNGKEIASNVLLLEDKKNIFDLQFATKSGSISTKNQLFKAITSGNELSFVLDIDSSRQIIQKYKLDAKDYTIDFSINAKGIENNSAKLNFENYIDKIEKGYRYEQSNTTVYFHKTEEKETDYCSCTGDDNEKLTGKKVNWIANTNQFFNSSLISKSGGFSDPDLSTTLIDFTKSDDLKKLTNNLTIPLVNGNHEMKWYIGPNDFNTLRSYGIGLEEIIPYGSSIFGSLNRWVIRPFFEFLNKFVSSKGIVILLVIFIIKMLLYPLLYKMLHSQAKMSALKPELQKIKDKHKDDLQKQQVESMKVYQEFGVSPFAGCLPMLMQMPIWIALYRFFPSSITFRQESFLWANDLSAYDDFFKLGFEIPFMGTHISLFTLLWAVSTLVYTYYSTKDVDMSANPAMKYVQYFMPLMFLGFFNSYASGLTCYMFLSNMINILQTIITKKFVFDESKIRKELEVQKSAPKKKGGFQSRLEEAMKLQQKMAEEKTKTKK